MRVKYDKENKSVCIHIPAEEDIFAPIITETEYYIWWLEVKEAKQLAAKLTQVVGEKE